MASTLSSRTFALSFLFLPVFVVVSIVTRLFVMSYRLSIHEKNPCCPIKGQWSVFFASIESYWI